MNYVYYFGSTAKAPLLSTDKSLSSVYTKLKPLKYFTRIHRVSFKKSDLLKHISITDDHQRLKYTNFIKKLNFKEDLDFQ